MTRFFFSVWQLWISWCSAFSLTRGWVCSLLVQLLLDLARAVTLGSKSRRTHNHILLSDLRLSHPEGPGPRIYTPQEHGGPVIPPGTGFPFPRLLRLAGLGWRYCNPPPHGMKYCPVKLYNSTDGSENHGHGHTGLTRVVITRTRAWETATQPLEETSEKVIVMRLK
jgi:hypothetical protein